MDPDSSSFNLDPDPSSFNLDPDPSSFNLGLGTYYTLLSRILYNPNNATALELCKIMRKLWHIKGHNNDNKEDNGVNNDSMGLETSLGTVNDKQSLVRKQKCFNCGKIGHRSAKCPHKKKKGPSEKAGTAADASIKKTKPKCSHCGKPGHKEEDCWKKHPHKAPSRSSMEASETFLDEELLV